MKSFLLSLVVSASILLSAQEVVFHVNPGDELQSVLEGIRAQRNDGRLMTNDSVSVVFAPGDYMLDRAIELDVRDSGSERSPFVWRAEKPGRVRFIGGRLIPRDAFKPVSGAGCERLDPAVRDKVLEADVTSYLALDPRPWPDHPTGVMPGVWLYHDGRSQTIARWPNRDAVDGGWFGFSNVLENCGWQLDCEKPAVFEFPGDRPLRWRFNEGVWVTGYLIVDWDCDTVRIASYDKATHGARLASATTWGGWQGRLAVLQTPHLRSELA